MTHLQSTRPIAPLPVFDAIPPELTERRQWVVWRYELRGPKWTKVPYTPGTTTKAASNRSASWASFADAVACYRARPDYFDGIGYMFTAEDPYVGGDFDHCIDEAGQLTDFVRQHLPATYTEISPSGSGVKFIARATIDSARKTSRVELYARGRFFTITGHLLAGQPGTIENVQAEIDALQAAIRDMPNATKEGTRRENVSEGSRAELAAQIPEAEWAAARRLIRSDIEPLKRRLARAAGAETQLAYLLRDDFTNFHQRWPHVGIVRADGTIDNSQVRAVAASGIKGRGFTFAEFVVLMSIYYADQALAKWGTKQLWREELVSLWMKAAEPKRGVRLPSAPARKAPTAPRGRAGEHSALVEHVYTLLQERRAGASAIIQIDELATASGVHRRTISTILAELRDAGRIASERFGQHGGLVVTFLDMIYSVTITVESGGAMPECDEPDAALEETKAIQCVSSNTPEADHISEGHISQHELYLWADEALDCYPGRADFRKVRAHVAMLAAGRPFSSDELYSAYQSVRKQRSFARRDEQIVREARAMGLRELRRRSQSFAAKAAAVERACKAGVQMPSVLTFELDGRSYQTRAPQKPTLSLAAALRHIAGLYAAEESRRAARAELPNEARRTATVPATQSRS